MSVLKHPAHANHLNNAAATRRREGGGKEVVDDEENAVNRWLAQNAPSESLTR